MDDQTIEEKIKKAARELFTRQGFDSTTTREIAREAGVNIASINYYYRSKDKLFKEVMSDTVKHFYNELLPVLNDKTLSLLEKVAAVVNYYIDDLVKNPDVPFFIISEILKRSDDLPFVSNREAILQTDFARQLAELATPAAPDRPVQIIMSLAGMLFFPFVSRPQLLRNGSYTETEFTRLMQERKAFVIDWAKMIIG